MWISRGWIKWELNMSINGKTHGFIWSYYLQSVAHDFLVPARSHGVKMAWKRAGLLLDDKKTHEARARWRERRRPSFKELSTGSLDLITCVSCVHMVFDPYHAAPEKPWIFNEFSKLAGDCPITALTRQSMTLTWQITPLKRHRMMDYVQKTGSLSCHRFSYQLDHPGFCGQGAHHATKKVTIYDVSSRLTLSLSCHDKRILPFNVCHAKIIFDILHSLRNCLML
jgi:hypothetical protein